MLGTTEVRDRRRDQGDVLEPLVGAGFEQFGVLLQEPGVQVGALERSLLAQERLLRTKEAGYRSGLNGILEVLDVQQELSQVSQALTKARYDYILNSLRLKFTAGNLEDADLAAINQWLVDDDS